MGLRGERVAYDGEHYVLQGLAAGVNPFVCRSRPRRTWPIYLAARTKGDGTDWRARRRLDRYVLRT